MVLGADFRTEVISRLSPLFGGGVAEATKFLADFEGMIRKSAGEGATTAVKPMVIGALVAGGLAAVLSVVAIAAARRRPKALGCGCG